MSKLAVCTPVYDGRAHASFFRGVQDIQRTFAKRGVQVAQMDAGHSANLPRLRNALASQALEWGADAILWIDSDIAASGADALRLWESDKDIIGSAPQKRPLMYGEEPSVAFKPLPGGRIAVDGEHAEVGGVATAFCLHRRGVYERMRAEGIAKPLVNRDGPASEWFCNFFWYELEQTPEGWVDDGEDFYLCRKARELGFQCFIDLKVRPVHHEGRMRLPVNFWDIYGAQVNGDDHQG